MIIDLVSSSVTVEEKETSSDRIAPQHRVEVVASSSDLRLNASHYPLSNALHGSFECLQSKESFYYTAHRKTDLTDSCCFALTKLGGSTTLLEFHEILEINHHFCRTINSGKQQLSFLKGMSALDPSISQHCSEMQKIMP